MFNRQYICYSQFVSLKMSINFTEYSNISKEDRVLEITRTEDANQPLWLADTNQ